MFGFITTNKWWPRMQIGYQVKKRKPPQGLTTWALYHDCEDKKCQTGEEVTSEIGYLDFSEDVSASYTRYTERLAAQNGAQTLTSSSENISDNKGLTNPIVQKTFPDGVYLQKILKRTWGQMLLSNKLDQ